MYSPGFGRVTSISNRPFTSATVWPTVRLTVCTLSAIAEATRPCPNVAGVAVASAATVISTVALTVLYALVLP